MMFRSYLLFSILVILSFPAFAGLTEQIQALEKKYKSRIGISAIHAESGQKFHYRGDEWFKLASTNKVPIAVTILKMAEYKQLDLDEMIDIRLSDITPGSGLMGYFFSRPGLSISVYNLLESMIAISDNSSTDTLLRRIGGIQKVQQLLKQHRVDNISVDRSILDMYLDVEAISPRPAPGSFDIHRWNEIKSKVSKDSKSKSYRTFYKDKKDATTPRGMTNLLRKIYDGRILSPEYSHLLFEIMTHTLPSNGRISKNLPSYVKVANKTGTWWDKDPITKTTYHYTNDVGMIVTKAGDHILLSVYVNSAKQVTKKEQVNAIADSAKLIYDEFVKGD